MAGIAYVDVKEGSMRVDEEWYEKTMLLALDEGDTTTPTERQLMAQGWMKERPNRRKFRQQDQELPENMSKTVTSFFLDFIFIPRLRIYPLVVPWPDM